MKIKSKSQIVIGCVYTLSTTLGKSIFMAAQLPGDWIAYNDQPILYRSRGDCQYRLTDSLEWTMAEINMTDTRNLESATLEEYALFYKAYPHLVQQNNNHHYSIY